MGLPYREGLVFAVPLRSSGFALGVIARVSPDYSGAVLGYFFGPPLESLPGPWITSELRAEKAVRALRFVDRSLRNGRWPIVCSYKEWNRTDWPIPPFLYKDTLSQTAWRVRYSDESMTSPIAEDPVPFETEHEPDLGYSANAIEVLLTKELG